MQLNIIIMSLILRNLHIFVTVCISVRIYVPRTRWSNVQETSTSSRSSGSFASSSSEGSPPWAASPCRHGRLVTVICRPIAAHHSSTVFSSILSCYLVRNKKDEMIVNFLLFLYLSLFDCNADGSYRENSLGPGEQEHREVRDVCVCEACVCVSVIQPL